MLLSYPLPGRSPGTGTSTLLPPSYALNELASFNAHSSSIFDAFVQQSANATAVAMLRLALALYC
ncbi:MAG: hypothetical protein H6557_30035 [Lewinellaceae bacterium]|nr:hypothetical protein [Lewinellaceae bacterium]